MSCGRIVRRALPIAAVVAIGFGLGGAGWYGYRFVTTSPRFAITAIEVRGNVHVTSADVRALLPVHVGDNTFGADLGAARRALLANPWIADVEVTRALPHTVLVSVQERQPVAIASVEPDATSTTSVGALYLVDASGHPFKRATIEAGEGAELPIITGLDRTAYRTAPELTAKTVRDTLGALAVWRAGDRPAIGEAHLDPTGALVLHTYAHATAIRLGVITDPAALADRLATFDASWRELTPDERQRTRTIRLDTRTDHVTVAFAPTGN